MDDETLIEKNRELRAELKKLRPIAMLGFVIASMERCGQGQHEELVEQDKEIECLKTKCARIEAFMEAFMRDVARPPGGGVHP